MRSMIPLFMVAQGVSTMKLKTYYSLMHMFVLKNLYYSKKEN